MIGTLYQPGAGFLHRFDPRAKLLLLLELIVLFFLPLPLGPLAGYLGALAGLTAVAVGPRQALRPVRLLLPILLLVLLLTPPFYREGRILLALRGFPLLTSDGLAEALRLVVRFTGISLALFAFLLSTDPEDLVLSLRWFGLPFSLSLVLSVALQYIPYLAALYAQVQEAHRLRQAGAPPDGAPPDGTSQAVAPQAGPGQSSVSGARSPARGFKARLGQQLPVLTSVLILAVRRIPLLAMALETRGLGLRRARSAYRCLKRGSKLVADAAALAGLTAGLVVSVLVFH